MLMLYYSFLRKNSKLFFEYYRIVKTTQTLMRKLYPNRPFFWMLENVASMRTKDKNKV